MKHNNELDFSRAVLIVLVILVHIVNFGNLYPLAKSSIFAFMMTTFLFITGYLVNIDKSIKDFLRYLLQIFLPYIIFVMGYAVLSLYMPVRDWIETLDWPTIVNVLCVKSIGPYWFFHTMIVCGTIYYTVFQTFRSLSTAAKYSLFAAVLIAVVLWTPILNIKAAVYYFVGVGIRLYVGDFSRVYVKSLLACFAIRPAYIQSGLPRLGLNIHPYLCGLLLVFLLVSIHFLQRSRQDRGRIYRQEHFPNLRFPSDIHHAVQVFASLLPVWANRTVACFLYYRNVHRR